MSKVPNLLNDDGTASMATALMMSHHGLRRDLARFVGALERLEPGDAQKSETLREEWKSYHATLHGHHEAEDGGMFPNLAAQHESVKATIEKLGADHRRIDPLLERGDAAFGELPRTASALALVRELKALLDPHLAIEESELIPFLREMKSFPPPPNEEAAAMYAQGFSWAMQGVAPSVLEKVNAMLPEALTAKLDAARAAFDERTKRVWGSVNVGAATTPIPDGYV
jgi:hypothetical protein